MTLGCCGGVLQEFRIVMRGRDGSTAVVSFEREIEAIQLLELIAKYQPACAIGFTDENKQRFGVTGAQ